MFCRLAESPEWMDPFLCRKNFRFIFTFKTDELFCKSPGFLQHLGAEFHSLQ